MTNIEIQANDKVAYAAYFTKSFKDGSTRKSLAARRGTVVAVSGKWATVRWDGVKEQPTHEPISVLAIVFRRGGFGRAA